MAKRKSNKSQTRGLYQRESGMWYSRITDSSGKIIRKALSMDKSTAQLILNELRKQLDLERMGISTTPVSVVQFKTFAELREHYLRHFIARGVSQSTISLFEFCYKRVVLENRFVYLRDMTLSKVEEWARRTLSEGVRGQSINIYVGQVRCALRWAFENRHIPDNPLSQWQTVRNSDSRLRRDFQPEEIQRFFEAEKDPEWHLRWLVYFQTGFRLSAGINIRWEWIDWAGRVIKLPVEANKSNRDLAIPMSRLIHDALSSKHKESGSPEEGLIYPTVSGAKIRARLRQLCMAAGIDPRGLCTHSIRHTVATQIYNNTGKNLKAVQEILGHSNAATTLRYLHVTADEKRNAVESLNFLGELDSIAGGENAALEDGVSIEVI